MTVLSNREIQIIQYKAQGFTAKEISKKIGLEYRTIEIYMSNIRRKLEAKNMVHAIYIAIQKNILKEMVQVKN
jgi:LuxR family transcriptional activator of conjugal transfer of Ti plasmids